MAMIKSYMHTHKLIEGEKKKEELLEVSSTTTRFLF